MNAKDIRQTFLEFFKSKSHEIVPSAPMVLKNDPTLMFTNAGMNQFKDLFLGNKPIIHSRIADTQKCLRVSGKHNDLEEVGIDTYHHTMFEMLGNWSFGDYFKQEAITWAWELLTDKYKIDKNRIYVTYFEGDKTENLMADSEAQEIWRTFLSDKHILPGNKKDNFWEMGDTGPCGPCSEIHIDLRDADEIAKLSGAFLVNKSHPQVVEIWNLVFIQYNRKANGTLELLPNKHVDTGMGFERLCMALQGKKSNYDTDVFTPIIFRIEELSGYIYGKNEKTDIAMRVISDHVRAVGMSIADGQLPSNTGSGYVIRRILRRAIRYGYSFLNMKQPFIFKLTEELTDTLGEAFPELAKQSTFIANVIREEEQSFLRTLENGLSRLKELTSQSVSTISGERVFELYDTFGFPVDLTRLIAAEHGMSIDEKGFEEKLKEQKERSKAAGKMVADDWIQANPDTLIEFVGYDQTSTNCRIIKYRKVSYKNKEVFQLVITPTPFYAESGGQVGDKGWLKSAKEKIRIIDTIKENDLIIHLSEAVPQNPELSFEASIDLHARKLTASNHSATHLLHATLRKILGLHVEQRGSLVSPDYLRFDFSHHSKVSLEELAEIEKLVNQKVRENILLDEKRDMPFDEAGKLGAMMLFGEKYGNKVRVITFDPGFSIELCGGTHVKATGEIGYFKILSESSVAAGVRRIEAVTSDKAEAYINEELSLLQALRQIARNPKDPIKGIEQMIKENEALNQKLSQYKALQLQDAKQHLIKSGEKINDTFFIAMQVDIDADSIKNLSFDLKRTYDDLFAVIATEQDGKAFLSVVLGDRIVNKGLNAKEIIIQIGKHIQGSGGGQPFYATAGGKHLEGISAALEAARSFI